MTHYNLVNIMISITLTHIFAVMHDAQNTQHCTSLIWCAICMQDLIKNSYTVPGRDTTIHILKYCYIAIFSATIQYNTADLIIIEYCNILLYIASVSNTVI